MGPSRRAPGCACDGVDGRAHRLRARPIAHSARTRRRLLPHVRAHRQGPVASVRVARIHHPELVSHAGGVPAHRRGLDSADRSDHLHAQHPAGRVRRRRRLRRRCRTRRGDPVGSAGDGAGGCRCRVHGHLRRSRCADHSRGDRRAGGPRHRSYPPTGGPAGGGLDVRGLPAQRRGDHHRPGRRLHLRRLHPERLRRGVRVDADTDHRPARGADLHRQVADVRA